MTNLRAHYVAPFYRIHAIRPKEAIAVFRELGDLPPQSGTAAIPKIARAMLAVPDGAVSVILTADVTTEMTRRCPRTFQIWSGDVRASLQREANGSRWRFRAETLPGAEGYPVGLMLTLDRRPAPPPQLALAGLGEG